MSVPDEVPGGKVGAVCIVTDHIVGVAVAVKVPPDQDKRNAGLLQQADRFIACLRGAENDAVRALPDGNLHRAQLIRGVLGGVHEKRRDAAGAEVLLNAPEHNGEVRVDDVRQNDRNNGASALPDAARLKIGNIVQFLRHPTDQRLGCGGDVRLVPQGVGYRVDRKAGRVGNILQSCFHMHPPDLYCLYYTIFRRKKQEFFSDP